MKNIPVLHVCENSPAAAHERVIVALHEHGAPFRTQYDKPGAPPGLDCTMKHTPWAALASPRSLRPQRIESHSPRGPW